MQITIEGWDPEDKQPVRGTLQGVDRAQTQAADLVTVHLAHGGCVHLKQNPTALRGSNIRVGACAWDGAYVLSAWLDAQPPGSFTGSRCVELGAGMALVGLVLARLGAAVYLTDKPSMTVHARVNAAKNKLLAAAAAPNHQAAAAAAAGRSCSSTLAEAAAAQCCQGQPNKPPAEMPAVSAPAPGSVAVVGLDWENAAAAAAAAASITAAGAIDLIVATDCIYPDPNGTVPSSRAFMAAVAALATRGHTRVLVSFESRSDELRAALLTAAEQVDGGCAVRRLEQQELPEAYRTQHIELYELRL